MLHDVIKPHHPHRRRTFGRKSVKLSSLQKTILETLLPLYEINWGTLITDPAGYFTVNGPLHLEIGFGGGEYTASLARSCADHRIIACEIFMNGIANLLKEIQKSDIRNIRIVQGDAIKALEELFGEEVFDFIHVNHPDPWHKKKHLKRRLIQPRTVQLFSRTLKAEGELWLSTDVTEYAEWMSECLEGSGLFEPLTVNGRFLDQLPGQAPSQTLVTRYEDKGKVEGRMPRYMRYRKI